MAKPRLKSRKAMTIAYIEHKGGYGEVPWDEYMKRLFGWAKEQKVRPGFYPMAICYDDPAKVAAKDCRSDIAISFKGKAEAKSGINVREMPAMEVVTLSHKGPGKEFTGTYAMIHKWIEENGYKEVGAPMESYSKKPKVVKGVTIIYAKVMIPVEKK